MNCLLKPRFKRLPLKICLAGLVSLAAPAGLAAAGPETPPAVSGPAGQLDKITPQLYHCDDHNVRLPVTYIETGGGSAYAVMAVEGKLISMVRVQAKQPAADAENAAAKPAMPQYYYLSLDEQNSYRWRPNGDTARLSFLADADSAQEQIVYAACEATRKGE